MAEKYSPNWLQGAIRLKLLVFGTTAPTHDSRINYGFDFK